MADTPFASELSYFVFQQRRRESELSLPQSDQSASGLRTVSGYHPRVFIADPDMGQALLVEDERLALPEARRHGHG
jgi:hypothetical protein